MSKEGEGYLLQGGVLMREMIAGEAFKSAKRACHLNINVSKEGKKEGWKAKKLLL